MDKNELQMLAERCDVRDRQLQAIMADYDRMSAERMASAVAALITIDPYIFRDCAAALRSRT